MSTLSTSPNPLLKHFRQPVLYTKLISNGRWYPEGTLEMPVTGEVPIYAMTARDEITMKTPDALLNGAGTVAVIESCCPSIKNAWKVPAVDIDPLLISIRIATYGKEMEFTAVCPHCKTVNEKALDLSIMLDRITVADWVTPIKIAGLEIILKPQNYEELNKNNLLNFEEQRIMKVVTDDNLTDEEKTAKFGEMFKKLVETGISQVSKSIAGIKTENGVVVEDPKFIMEFLENCDRAIWDAVKDRLTEIQTQSKHSDITITCVNEECVKEFVTPFVFEQSSFFD
jgi:phage FluMu protein Com